MWLGFGLLSVQLFQLIFGDYVSEIEKKNEYSVNQCAKWDRKFEKKHKLEKIIFHRKNGRMLTKIG